MSKTEVRYVSIPDRRKRTEDRRKVDQFETVAPMSNYALEVEQSLIGALLLDNSALSRIKGIVGAEHFYRDDHRRIFGHICNIIISGHVADIVTAFAEIEASNEVEITGGLAYLGEIANNTPSAANILTYARIVRESALQRELEGFGERVTEIATSAGNTPLADRFRAAQEAWKIVSAEYREYATIPTEKP